jgi:gliding motility-associated-like protein
VPDSVVIPNVFTPNGDMQNDFFAIENIQGFDQAVLQVFNRWGALVYEENDYVTNVWDGTEMNTGALVAEGVYFYVLNIRDDGTGWTETLTGTVTVFTGGTR